MCAHLALVAGDISDDPAVMRPNDAVLRIDFAQASIAIVCGRFDLVRAHLLDLDLAVVLVHYTIAHCQLTGGYRSVVKTDIRVV